MKQKVCNVCGKVLPQTKKCCGNCVYYMSDEDECGNVTDFHHDRNKDEGFCAIRDLFYTVKNYEKACTEWQHDGLTPQHKKGEGN